MRVSVCDEGEGLGQRARSRVATERVDESVASTTLSHRSDWLSWDSKTLERHCWTRSALFATWANHSHLSRPLHHPDTRPPSSRLRDDA